MKINNRNILEKINFADFNVLETKLDKEKKIIIFTLNGAYRSVDGKKIELGKGYIAILKYDCVKVTSYNAKENIEHVLSEDQYEQLCEICEIDVCENTLVIKGFAKLTTNWIEFTIIGGEIKGEFLDSN